jgi:protein-tyrosine-phosphatase
VRSSIVAALDEIGVPIGGEFPKPLTDEVVRAADVVVTMGCGDACPVYPGRRYLDWELDDPAGLPLPQVRAIRDDIEGRVRGLLEELAATRPRGQCAEEARCGTCSAGLSIDGGLCFWHDRKRAQDAEKPTVLFVCVHNAGRSQMAAGFLRALAGDRVEVLSAGSEPKDRINPVAIEAMAEEGIDIAGSTPKILTVDAVRESDVVITMGCGDACPIFPGKRYEDWELEDPAGKDLVTVRRVRDDIRGRVEALIAELVQATA